MIERCPSCETGSIGTPVILARGSKRRRIRLPCRACRHCKIIIIDDLKKMGGWTIWAGDEKLDL